MTVRILPITGPTLAALLMASRRSQVVAQATTISLDAERRANRLEARLHDALARGHEQDAELLDAAWREQIELCADAAHDARDIETGRPAGRVACCYVTAIGKQAP